MRLFNYETQRIIEGIDAKEAEQLIENGQAIQLDLRELDEFYAEADRIYDDYKNKVRALKDSDNPIYKQKDVLKYELDKLEKEYQEQSAATEEEYKEWRAEQLVAAKTRAARAVTKVSDEAKEFAEQFANRMKIAIAIDAKEGIAKLLHDIMLLTDEQKTALQPYILDLAAKADAQHKSMIITEIRNVKNHDLLAVKVAEQLPPTSLEKKRISDIAKKAARVPNAAFKRDRITPEIYEKYLKGGLYRKREEQND